MSRESSRNRIWEVGALNQESADSLHAYSRAAPQQLGVSAVSDVRRRGPTTLCTVQGGTHCGAYQSFDIANVAWEQLQKYSLP